MKETEAAKYDELTITQNAVISTDADQNENGIVRYYEYGVDKTGTEYEVVYEFDKKAWDEIMNLSGGDEGALDWDKNRVAVRKSED